MATNDEDNTNRNTSVKSTTNNTNTKASFSVLLAASATAGIISRSIFHPIDTMKARLQIQMKLDKGGYANLRDALLRSYRSEGVRGLYRGYIGTIVGSTPASCLYFTSYETVRDKFKDSKRFNNEGVIHLTAGMLAEVIACVIYVPVDVIKERLQIQKPGMEFYKGSWDAFNTIYKTEGTQGLYRGYLATVSSFGPMSALYFLFYERLKSVSMKYDNATTETELNQIYFLLSGCLAGGLSSFLTSPLDLVKLRLQVQRRSGPMQSLERKSVPLHFHYTSFCDGLISIAKTEGIRGLWKGGAARVIYVAPGSAVTIASFELLKLQYMQVLDKM
jgi:hypothetical protein